MMNDFTASFIIVIIGVALLIFGATVIYGIDYLWGDYGCTAVASGMHKEHKYSFWTGCTLKIGDEYIPLKSYKYIEE